MEVRGYGIDIHTIEEEETHMFAMGRDANIEEFQVGDEIPKNLANDLEVGKDIVVYELLNEVIK